MRLCKYSNKITIGISKVGYNNMWRGLQYEVSPLHIQANCASGFNTLATALPPICFMSQVARKIQHGQNAIVYYYLLYSNNVHVLTYRHGPRYGETSTPRDLKSFDGELWQPTREERQAITYLKVRTILVLQKYTFLKLFFLHFASSRNLGINVECSFIVT